MSAITRHETGTHEVHLPLTRPRTVAAVIVAACGAALLTLTVAANLFSVGSSFEALMTDFRPHLTSSSIATSRADLAGLGAAGTELQTSLAPAMAQRLGMTPTEFNAYVAKTYPQVSAGMAALPQITTTFDGLVTTLDQQRPLFRSADAIPTTDLPATSVPWSMAVAGALLLATGGLMWFRPQTGAVLALVLGALLVVGSLAVSLPGKSSDADQLNSNLNPVYTATMVTQAKGSLATVSGMATQLQDEMLPGLAAKLSMTPTQVQQMLAQSFPATAAALGNLPAAMPRFTGLVTTFEGNLGNYNTIKPVSFVPIVWSFMGLGFLAGLAGATALLWPRHEVVPLRV